MTRFIRMLALISLVAFGIDPVRASADAPPPSSPAPSSAHRATEHGRAAVGMNLGFAFRKQAAYDLFAEDDLALRVGILLGYDVLRIDRTAFAVEGAFDAESSEAALGGGEGSASLRAHTYSGAVVVRHGVTPWLEPHLRLELGATLVRARISGQELRTLRGSDTSFSSALGAGLTFRTVPGALGGERSAFRSAGFAFRIEGGYLLGTAVDLRLRPALAEDDIAVAPVDLGRMRRGAPYLRMTFLFTF